MSRKNNKRWTTNNPRFLAFLALTAGLILAACSSPQPVATPTSMPPFKPPVSGPSATPVEHQIPSPTPTTKRSCTNQLRFVNDLSIPDGTIVSPGDQLDKRWQVENTGTCDWNQEYSLRLVAGEALDAPRVQKLYPARRGSRVTIQIAFTAPTSPGHHSTTWQAFDPSGQRFGDPFFMDITVE